MGTFPTRITRIEPGCGCGHPYDDGLVAGNEPLTPLLGKGSWDSTRSACGGRNSGREWAFFAAWRSFSPRPKPMPARFGFLPIRNGCSAQLAKVQFLTPSSEPPEQSMHRRRINPMVDAPANSARVA